MLCWGCRSRYYRLKLKEPCVLCPTFKTFHLPIETWSEFFYESRVQSSALTSLLLSVSSVLAGIVIGIGLFSVAYIIYYGGGPVACVCRGA